ncbi:helix-turn-helix transcriptional regulator [Nonomuraea sp. SMC257]|uniref:Helix-turn-helix transcriptional regulator n=1 Tax=Nonomuraea montanisoli TaxID=2741721 RepID=A0A7Y6IH03_9ACTN|nr:DUF5937 family protein [Nonomuraea montanisoli]NUW37926.1 helix-turn-helix transcriptional regulator [Nonomuraea montanisoli]
MALRMPLSGAEAAKLRFGVSPLAETVLAVRMLCGTVRHPVYERWARAARPLLAREKELPLLARVVSGCLPSFLFPVPGTRQPAVADELDRLRATPAAYVEAELAAARVALPGDGLCGRLADALARCHDRLVAPQWDRMRAVLDADIAEQGVRLTNGGIAGLLGVLHDDVAWRDGELLVRGPCPADTMTLHGHGLVLSPTVFGWPRVIVDRSPLGAGCVRYPARGVGHLWEASSSLPEGLAAVLGRTRTALIEALEEPLSTGRLAVMLGITPGAVSQHLGALRRAGLVVTRREGRTAEHLRTERAAALIGGRPAKSA